MFTSTLSHIFTISNFRLAFDEISSNAIGIDNISYQEFKEDFSNQIKNLIHHIFSLFVRLLVFIIVIY